MSKRVLIPVAIFAPLYAYFGFSWTGCLDGSCSGADTTSMMVLALITFPLVLLLVGVGSALGGTGNLRDGVEADNAQKTVLAGLDLWLGVKLIVVAIVGFTGTLYLI